MVAVGSGLCSTPAPYINKKQNFPVLQTNLRKGKIMHLPDFERMSSCTGSPSSIDATYCAASPSSLVTFSRGWRHSSRRNSTAREPDDALFTAPIIKISAVTRISRPATSTRRQYHNLVTSRSAMEWRRGASLRTFCCCKVDWLASSSSSGNWYRGRKMASTLQSLDSSNSYLLIYMLFYIIFARNKLY